MKDALDSFNDPDLQRAVALFASVPPARVLAFNWRQAVVDEFLGWWDANLRDRGVSSDCRRAVRLQFYQIFCWMKAPQDRAALDAVLGPVVEVQEPWGTSYQRRMFEVDGRVPIWRNLFSRREETELGWKDLNRRWATLSAEERCDIWPRYLALVDRPCESKPDAWDLYADAPDDPLGRDGGPRPTYAPAPSFRPVGDSLPGFWPAPAPTCHTCSAGWSQTAKAAAWT
jgi:hypothetical protein